MRFVGRVGTPEGRVLVEAFEAQDETALRSDLERRGYRVFELRRRGVPLRLSLPRPAWRRKVISDDRFLIFNRELAALLRAGLPVLEALELMLERMRQGPFRSVLTDVRDRVKSGEDLSQAFAAHGDAFPRLYPSTLKGGEKSGELERVIRRFIRYMNLVIGARKRVISALIYPTVLVALSVLMVIVLSLYVIPNFMGFFENMETELPVLTQMTMGITLFIKERVPWIATFLVMALLVFLQWRRTAAGTLSWDRWKLRLPFLGYIAHRFSLSEFCRSLATLLGGGTPLVPALEISVGAVGNAYIRQRLRPGIDRVREGEALYVALEESAIFTELAVDMVKVGEATGALDEMLNSVSDFLDEQVEVRLQRILSLVEPLLLIMMGIIIAILLVSIYLPLFNALGQTRF